MPTLLDRHQSSELLLLTAGLLWRSRCQFRTRVVFVVSSLCPQVPVTSITTAGPVAGGWVCSDHYILQLLFHWMGATSENAQLLRVTVKPRIQKDKWSLYWKVCCWTLRCTFLHCQCVLKDGPRRQCLTFLGEHAELLSKAMESCLDATCGKQRVTLEKNRQAHYSGSKAAGLQALAPTSYI